MLSRESWALGAAGQGVCGEEDDGHGRGGEDEAGGGRPSRRPHQGQGPLGLCQGPRPLDIVINILKNHKI